MEPFGRLPLEAGGTSGVGTRRQLAQNIWNLNRFHVRSDPTGLIKTLAHMLPPVQVVLTLM